jgi:hypothetical protein
MTRKPTFGLADLSCFTIVVSRKWTMALEDLRLLNRKQAAAFIRERISAGSVAWLAKLARTHEGPAFKIIASRALYRPQDLEIWIAEQWNREPSHISAVDHATSPVVPNEPIADEQIIAEPVAHEYVPSVDLDAIEQGLRLVRNLQMVAP